MNRMCFALLVVSLLLTACATKLGTTEQTDQTADTARGSLEPDGRPLRTDEGIELELDLRGGFDWYSRFLGASFFTAIDAPDAELNLHLVFANGEPGDEIATLTEAEKEFLFADTDPYGVYRLSQHTVTEVLMEYLGVSAKEAMDLAVADPGMHYWEETRCFYTVETYNSIGVGVYAAYERSDGTISIYYRDMWDIYYGTDSYSHVAILQPKDDGYVILSNMPIDP